MYSLGIILSSFINSSGHRGALDVSMGNRSIEVENALIHLRRVTGQFGPFKRDIICRGISNALK